MEEGAQKQEILNEKVERRLLGKNFSLFGEDNLQRLQRKQEESTGEEEMKLQQRMMIMKDLTKNIRSKERMNAKNRLWVSELLVADSENVWIHTGWDDTVQKWFEWLEEMKKMDEKEKMEEMHQQKVAQMMKSAEGKCGSLAQKSPSLQHYSMEGSSTDVGK